MAAGLRKLATMLQVRRVVVCCDRKSCAQYLQPDFCVEVVATPLCSPMKISDGDATITCAAARVIRRHDPHFSSIQKPQYRFDVACMKRMIATGPGGWDAVETDHAEDLRKAGKMQPHGRQFYKDVFWKPTVRDATLQHKVLTDSATAAAASAFELTFDGETSTSLKYLNVSHELLEPTTKWKDIAAIVGPSGSGKTTAVTQLLKDLQNPKNQTSTKKSVAAVWGVVEESAAVISPRTSSSAKISPAASSEQLQDDKVSEVEQDRRPARGQLVRDFFPTDDGGFTENQRQFLQSVLGLSDRVLQSSVASRSLSTADRECIRLAKCLFQHVRDCPRTQEVDETPACDGEPTPLLVIDEFTSLLSRTRAEHVCKQLAQWFRGGFFGKLRLLVVGVHEDVVDWLRPSFALHTNSGCVSVPSADSQRKNPVLAEASARAFSEKKSTNKIQVARTKSAQKVREVTGGGTQRSLDFYCSSQKKAPSTIRSDLSRAKREKDFEVLQDPFFAGENLASAKAVVKHNAKKRPGPGNSDEDVEIIKPVAQDHGHQSPPRKSRKLSFGAKQVPEDGVNVTLNGDLAGDARDGNKARHESGEVETSHIHDPEQVRLFAAPKLSFVVKPLPTEFDKVEKIWKDHFEKHHYLRPGLPKGMQSFLVRDATSNQSVAFYGASVQCGRGLNKACCRETRMVILPEFQGLGIGPRLSDAMAQLYLDHGCTRYFGHTGHPGLGGWRNNSSLWLRSKQSEKPEPVNKPNTNFNKSNKASAAPKQKAKSIPASGVGPSGSSCSSSVVPPTQMRVMFRHEFLGRGGAQSEHGAGLEQAKKGKQKAGSVQAAQKAKKAGVAIEDLPSGALMLNSTTSTSMLDDPNIFRIECGPAVPRDTSDTTGIITDENEEVETGHSCNVVAAFGQEAATSETPIVANPGLDEDRKPTRVQQSGALFDIRGPGSALDPIPENDSDIPMDFCSSSEDDAIRLKHPPIDSD
ncbi:unnamed protein product [Amoebophrya sp. A120]|nr:unnamed protein product [Amoebophrya sp. A120]|eukprot:GSA120T00002085001.1